MFGTNRCDSACDCATGCDPITGMCDVISSSPTTSLIATESSTTSSTIQQLLQCKCPCSHLGDSSLRNITRKELNAAVLHLKEELFVDKSQLSSTKRKLTSAGDERASSHAIGCIGIIILTFVGAIIILADLSSLTIQHKVHIFVKTLDP